MILFDPIAITTALHAGTDALRATAAAPATLFQLDHGPLVAAVAAGVSDLESNTPAAITQTYEIGSQTKVMTAVAILQLVEQGKVDLDARAAIYLAPETISGIANAETVTVRQLLNMTSGIANYTDQTDAEGIPLFIRALQDHPDQVFGPQQALALMRDLPALGAPGAAYSYSNTSYLLLGQIIEQQTGQSFFDVLKAGIFDPAQMHDTVRQLGTDDPRLSSYLADQTGQLVDVTRAQWEMRGEAGIAATTDDMIRFLKALFVDKTLLGDAALAAMTEFVPTGANDVVDTGFGLGLVKFALIGGDTYYGFTGGTLGTASSTYLNIDTGLVVAVGATGSEVDTLEGAFTILQSLDPKVFNIVDDGSALRLMSGSAQALDLTVVPGGIAFELNGATLTLDRALRGITTANVTFADGSVLVVGDNQAGNRLDNRSNNIDILRDHAGAADRDNQLMGLGGNDVLKGGRGADKVLGGTGSDQLWGRAGNDVLQGDQGRDALYGGAGDDRLAGGTGRDHLYGGAGADHFIFAAGDSVQGQKRDVIHDFASGSDKIDLAQIMGGGPSGDLTFRGTLAFGGTAGEVRVQQSHGNTLVMVDINGNGRADLEICLTGQHHLTAVDFLL